LIVRWSGQFLFFVVLRQFSQVVGEWLENQILIPDWTYFYCPGTTLTNRQSNLRSSCQSIFSLCRHHPILIPQWVKLVEPYKVRLDINLVVPDKMMFTLPLLGPGC